VPSNRISCSHAFCSLAHVRLRRFKPSRLFWKVRRRRMKSDWIFLDPKPTHSVQLQKLHIHRNADSIISVFSSTAST
jgi:hypothetical protein